MKITIGDVKCLSHLGTEQIDGFRGEPPPPEGGQREQSGVVPVPERATDCVYKYGKSVMFSNDSCTKYKMFNPRLHTYMWSITISTLRSITTWFHFKIKTQFSTIHLSFFLVSFPQTIHIHHWLRCSDAFFSYFTLILHTGLTDKLWTLSLSLSPTLLTWRNLRW